MSQETTVEGLYGLLAEFRTPEALLQACEKIRERGFTDWDAHTPFPVHGLEQAMGLPRSKVPIFVLVLGLGGATFGMLMQWWVSAEAYPLVISGKPLFSWPAFVPVTFECGVLGGAVGALVGLLSQARLPRHHHPLFASEAFERATDDGFFVSLEACDARFDRQETERWLRSLGAVRVEAVGG